MNGMQEKYVESKWVAALAIDMMVNATLYKATNGSFGNSAAQINYELLKLSRQ